MTDSTKPPAKRRGAPPGGYPGAGRPTGTTKERRKKAEALRQLHKLLEDHIDIAIAVAANLMGDPNVAANTRLAAAKLFIEKWAISEHDILLTEKMLNEEVDSEPASPQKQMGTVLSLTMVPEKKK